MGKTTKKVINGKCVCTACGENKKLSEFTSSPGRRLGVNLSRCKSCSAKINRIAYASNPDKFRDSANKYDTANIEKRRAWRMINYRVKTGEIVKPSKCEDCGKKCNPDGHHKLGYEGANALVVSWLCRQCHKDEHAKNADSGKIAST